MVKLYTWKEDIVISAVWINHLDLNTAETVTDVLHSTIITVLGSVNIEDWR